MMSKFTIAGLVHNLGTIRELIAGAQVCYANEGLDEFAESLVKVSIYIVDKTRERAMTTVRPSQSKSHY
jgi:hypothetical protein